MTPLSTAVAVAVAQPGTGPGDGPGTGPGMGPATQTARALRELTLAAAVEQGGGLVTDKVEVIPVILELEPDAVGPVARGTARVVNRTPDEQMVWISDELPDVAELSIAQESPSVITLDVAVDVALAAALGARAPRDGRIYVMTPSGATTLRVRWRPLAFGGI